MYFEDIYKKIRSLWKETFSLEGAEKTKTYIEDIKIDFDRVEEIVDFSDKENYTEWESMLSFTMYQTLTAFALEKWRKEKAKTLSFSEIPITLFEEYFRKNMEPEDEFEGNPEYLKKYKGFKNPPSFESNKEV